MSVNDLLCVGAQPLFFLDYLDTGKLDSGVAEQVLEGIVEGCKQAQCALVGGETAEMPDFYAPGEYDLAGFAVGHLHPSSALPRKDIRAGDVLIGIRSTGCHSNGYSLLRKLLPSDSEADSIARELLTPTRIYVAALKSLLKNRSIKGLAHITGSGFLNVPRISERFSYEIQLPPEDERPPIFRWIRSQSGISFEEQVQTFNLGIGMVAVVSPQKSNEVLRKIKQAGDVAWVIGEVRKLRSGIGPQVILREGDLSTTLTY
jgi:phosphoribosylformylglycinamidine cyclo-ligase